MKIIRVESCSKCPYKKEHWSKPSGLIHEGTSCSFSKDTHDRLFGIQDHHSTVHKDCPLGDE